MSHHRPFKVLVAAGALFVGMANGRTAEAVIAIIHEYPIFGVVTGAQFARINAVLLPYIEQQPPCPVTLAFFDARGSLLGGPDTFELRSGAAVHSDFIGDPNQHPLQRVQLRAQVTIGDPNTFPGCAGGVITSVEVVDRITRATRVLLSTPLVHDVDR